MFVDPQFICVFVDPQFICVFVDPQFICVFVDPQFICVFVDPQFICVFADPQFICVFVDPQVSRRLQHRLLLIHQHPSLIAVDGTMVTEEELQLAEEAYSGCEKVNLWNFVCRYSCCSLVQGKG